MLLKYWLPSSTSMDINDEHSEKAQPSIEVTKTGIVIDVNDVQ